MENKATIRKKHQLVVGSQLPRKVRDLTATEKFMEKIRTDKSEGSQSMKLLSQKKRRDEKDRLKKSLLNDAKQENSEDEDYDGMDVDEVGMNDDSHNKKMKKRKLTPEEIAAAAKKERIENHKQVVVERMKRKIQKKWSRKAVVNEADRHIGSKLPKHLNTGKRSNGKTDWR